MFRTYDDWKLATPPEYDELGESSPHDELGPGEEEEPLENEAPQNPRKPPTP